MESFPVSLSPNHNPLYHKQLPYHRPQAQRVSAISTRQLKISCCSSPSRLCRQFPSARSTCFALRDFIHSLSISTAFSSTTARASGGIFPSPLVLIRCSSTDR